MNESKKLAPYGTWESPIDAALLAGASTKLTVAQPVGEELWWTVSKPDEKGRNTLICRKDNENKEVLPDPFNVRTRVHEYGGAPWWVSNSKVFFSNDTDNRIYSISSEQEAEPLTPEQPSWRFADGHSHPSQNFFVCVREDLNAEPEPKNEIVSIDLQGNIDVLVSGPDFVSNPRISPDGQRLSWIQWNHPHMPWQESSVLVANLDANGLVTSSVIEIAGDKDQAPQGANWLNSGELVYSNDVNGYWNLYKWNPQTNETEQLTQLKDSEIGYPPWVFGLQRWTEISDGRIVAVKTKNAADELVMLNSAGALLEIESKFCDIQQISSDNASKKVYVVGNSKTESVSLAMLEIPHHPQAGVGDDVGVSGVGDDVGVSGVGDDVGMQDGVGAVTDLKKSDTDGSLVSSFSEPEFIEFESNGRKSYGYFYEPKSENFIAEADILPPLIVMGHGGPTAHSSPKLNLKVQYWTSRGFAVVEINYGGSSGFGRAYRNLLNNQWGIVDVQDCIAAVEYLVESNKVDRSKIAIRGGSAGGFTVLTSLIKSDIFSAGCSLYGVSDLEALAQDTHKFESRYLDGLIGKYPEDIEIYKQRSPINNIENLNAPVLFLQGSEDKVVPPSQSKVMYEALREKGVEAGYVEFEGEQHGFRNPKIIVKSLELELWFYSHIFGFDPPDNTQEVEL